jgi:hypothetical protein
VSHNPNLGPLKIIPSWKIWPNHHVHVYSRGTPKFLSATWSALFLLSGLQMLLAHNSSHLTLLMSNITSLITCSFQIQVVYATKNIFRTMIDEGASTCVMSLSCWKYIDSPELTPSPTLLTTFDGHSFQPHGILSSFPI